MTHSEDKFYTYVQCTYVLSKNTSPGVYHKGQGPGVGDQPLAPTLTPRVHGSSDQLSIFFDRELYSLGPSSIYGHLHRTLSISVNFDIFPLISSNFNESIQIKPGNDPEKILKIYVKPHIYLLLHKNSACWQNCTFLLSITGQFRKYS